jgi:hypothetical protein
MPRMKFEQITRAEPRMVSLVRTAVLAVASGANPDRAYCDAKPFLAHLVGWRRGVPAVVDKPSDLQRRFARVITGTVFGADVAGLATSEAYDVAIDELYAAVCAAADRRERESA